MTYPAAATPTSATTTPRTTAALKTTPRFFLAIIEHRLLLTRHHRPSSPACRELFERSGRTIAIPGRRQRAAAGVSRLDAERLAGGFGDHDLPLLAYPNRARVLAVEATDEPPYENSTSTCATSNQYNHQSW